MGIMDSLRSSFINFFFDEAKLKQTTKEIENETNKNVGFEVATNRYSTFIEESLDYGIYGYSTRSELLNLKGFAEAQRCKKDPQIKANLDMLVFSVTGKNYVINTFDESRKAKQVTEFIKYVLDNIDGSIEDLLYELSLGIFYGYSLLEKVYQKCDSGKWNGKRVYKSFKGKWVGAYGFILDDFDNILAVQNLISSINLPKEKFVIYSWKKEFSNPYGSPTFDSVWRFWFAKSEIIRHMLVGASKASGLVVGTLKNGSDTAQINQAKTVVSNAISNAGIVKQENLLLEFLDVQGKNASDIYIQSLRWLDSQIALAIVGNSLTTNESQGSGSRAQAQVQAGVSTIYSKYLQRTLEETINEQIIKPLIKFNFGDTYINCMPTFQLIEDAQKNLTEFNANAEKLVNIGAIDMDNINDINKVREFNDFSEIDEEFISKRNEKGLQEQDIPDVNAPSGEQMKDNDNADSQGFDSFNDNNYSIDYDEMDKIEFQFVNIDDNDIKDNNNGK